MRFADDLSFKKDTKTGNSFNQSNMLHMKRLTRHELRFKLYAAENSRNGWMQCAYLALGVSALCMLVITQ